MRKIAAALGLFMMILTACGGKATGTAIQQEGGGAVSGQNTISGTISPGKLEERSALDEEGDRLAASGDTEKAEEQYLQAIAENAKDIGARLGFARLRIEKEDYESAERSLNMAARLAPGMKDIYEIYADLVKRSGSLSYGTELKQLAERNDQQWFLDKYVPSVPKGDLPDGRISGPEYLSLAAGEGETIRVQISSDGELFRETEYCAPIRITRGKTEVTAYSVRNSIPGEKATFSYEGDYPSIPVTFKDPAVEAITRFILKKPEGEITDQDCESITDFNPNEWYGMADYELTKKLKISSLEDLRWFRNLERLSILNNVTDGMPSGFEALLDIRLSTLYISGLPVSDLSFLKYVPELTKLHAPRCGLTDISGLKGNTVITTLYIDENPEIRDISPVTEMKQLKTLSVDFDQIEKLSQLQNCENLTNLQIEGGGRPLREEESKIIGGIKNLKYLYLYDAGISDLSFLKSLPNLLTLSFRGGDITDLSPLYDLKGLSTLTMRNLEHIPDIVQFKNLSKLKKLDLRGTDISENQANELKKMLPNCNIQF